MTTITEELFIMLYQSKHLTISYREKTKLLFPKWTGSALSPETFINEMKQYRLLMEKTKGSNVIWDHTNFTFRIPEPLFQWIEEEINLPAKRMGMKKIGFVLGEDVMAQFSTMDCFETTQSVYAPLYFSDPAKALNWAERKEKITINPFEKEIKLIIDKKREAGTATIQIDLSLEQLPFYLKHLKELFNQHAFVHKSYKKYMLLTEREKEILHLILSGYSSKAVAEQLFTSVHTVNTHRKKIMQKLDCKNVASLLRYKFFL